MAQSLSRSLFEATAPFLSFTGLVLSTVSLITTSPEVSLAEPPAPMAHANYATDIADVIAVGTVSDTTLFRCRENRSICTLFTLAVDTALKGTETSCSFADFGGTIGTRTTIVPHSQPIDLGDTLLVFLAPCNEFHHRATVWGPFHIAGDSVRIGDSLVPTDTVLADVQSRLSSVTPESLASSSDLVLQAEFTSISLAGPPHPWGQSGSASIAAVTVAKQTLGPTVAPQAELTIDIPETYFGSSWAPEGGTSPWLTPEHLPRLSVLFLSWTGSIWRLRPTAYAAWSIEGDSTYVFMESPYCPGTVYAPARMDSENFLTLISGY